MSERSTIEYVTLSEIDVLASSMPSAELSMSTVTNDPPHFSSSDLQPGSPCDSVHSSKSDWSTIAERGSIGDHSDLLHQALPAPQHPTLDEPSCSSSINEAYVSHCSSSDESSVDPSGKLNFHFQIRMQLIISLN
jgi:hypothetical protein